MSESSRFTWTEAALRDRLRKAPDRAAEPPRGSDRLSDYQQAVAVLSYFDPQRLRPVRGKEDPAAVELLLADCSVIYDHRGRAMWTLQDGPRRRALEQLGTAAEMVRALAPNRPAREEADCVQAMTEAHLEGSAPPIETQRAEELAATLQVIRWYHGLLEGLPRAEDVELRLELEGLLEPFRFLVGDHFSGREEELAELRSYVGVADSGSALESLARGVRHALSLHEQPPVLILGAGGVGKSTLVAKFVLDHLELRSQRQFPFAYLNFERSTVLQAHRPLTLVLEILRQLVIQFPELREEGATLRDQWSQQYRWQLGELEGLAATQSPEGRSVYRRVGESLFGSATVLSPPFEAVLPIVDQLGKLVQRAVDVSKTQFLLVLDTFEEVQYRHREELDDLFAMLERFQASLPVLRTVIAGRAPIDDVSTRELVLDSLPRQAAIQLVRNLLEEAEGDWSDLAEPLVERIGGHPLSLRLAVDVALAEGREKALASIKTRQFLFFRMKDRLVQGQLYSRLLGHVHHPEVQRLAQAGLALRSITPVLAAEVLAPACGIQLSPERAGELFAELAKETSLVYVREPGTLAIRPDLRKLMLDLQRQDDPKLMEGVHRRAVRYFAARETAADRLEELYHRLAAGQTSAALDERWIEGAERELSGSLADFPAAGKAYLLSKIDGPSALGISLTEEEERAIFAEADAASWVRRTVSRVEKLVERSRWQRAQEFLAEREERGTDGRLQILEALCLERTGHFSRARKVLDPGLAAAAATGDRAVLLKGYKVSARLAVQEKRMEAARRDLERASTLAQELERPFEELSLGLQRLELLRRPPADEPSEVTAVEERMAAVLAALPPASMRREAALVHRALAAIGESFPLVLQRSLPAVRLVDLDGEQRQALADSLIQWDTEVSELHSAPPGLVARSLSVGSTEEPETTWRQLAAQASPDGLLDTLQKLGRRYDFTPSLARGIANSLK